MSEWRLPVHPPVAPTLAKATATLPTDGNWVFEPKWDGFRGIIFKDGDRIEIGSRSSTPLTRYFPELVDALRAALPKRCVVDGEIVLINNGRLDFDALQLRLHPADSRVRMLAETTPAAMILFDLIALGNEDLREVPLGKRRDRLSSVLPDLAPPLYLTPGTTDSDTARQWFTDFEGAGLDGLIAKPLASTYQSGVRIFTKLKHERDLDAVIAGFRWHKSGPIIGSLLLGLYDDGALQHVGACSAFTMKRRAELVEELAPYRADALETHPWAAWAKSAEAVGARMPGAASRWSSGKDLGWEPVRPELVIEVGYDQFQGPRLRHLAKFRRWRPDRDAASCTFDQVERPADYPFEDVLRKGPDE